MGDRTREMREETPGRKDDASKPRWHLLPWRAAARVVAVLGKGADHYGADNWRRVPDLRTRYLDAALRHTIAVLRGEWIDPDDGEPHLAHAVASLLFVLEDEELRAGEVDNERLREMARREQG